MLWFIGLGISGFKSIPIEAIDVLGKADIVYLEQFTSPISNADIKKIKDATKGEFKFGKRLLNYLLILNKEVVLHQDT